MEQSKDEKNRPRKSTENTPDKIFAATPETNLHQHNPVDEKRGSNDTKAEHEPSEVHMGFVARWWHFVRDPTHAGAVMAIFTVIIAVTGALYTTVSFLQWRTMRSQLTVMQETYNAANKPSVGVNGILPLYVGLNEANQEVYSVAPTKQSINFVLRVEIKNFGPVTAEDFWITWKIFIDGVLVPHDKEEIPRHSKIFPGKLVYLPARIGTTDTQGISSGTKVLELEITVHDNERQQDYAYCEKHRYEPSVHAFSNLGACNP